MTPANNPTAIQRTLDDDVQDQNKVPDIKRLLVALDASEPADQALAESVRLVGAVDDGVVTGIHAYAAQLHDHRFRQMEGGLPERYLEEQEMEHQRDVHDDLITRGLSIITDSYHDVAAVACEKAGVKFKRLSPEGKNYRRLVEACESGEFDVMAMGALGLGVVPGSLIGTVCERVVRRNPIDSLVIKDASRAIGDGPIVVGIDGSEKSFGALMTAIEVSRRTGVPVHAVAAYDPYYHYVAFNKISTVLSEEAGKVFRFKEQEQLHEELIDDGIAKIYQSHLEVAKTIAEENDIDMVIELLEGKPFKAMNGYLDKVSASLVIVGKTGVHADGGLDIGGNAENLLRLSSCHVWLTQHEHKPQFEVIAEKTIAWSNEAEEYLARAPEFVQGMARKAVLRRALEMGHTFVTSDIVREVSEAMMPSGCPAAKRKEGAVPKDLPLAWTQDALALIARIDPSLHMGVNLRAEKHARREGAARVDAEHVRPFVDLPDDLDWPAAALARLARVPESMREKSRLRIEDHARSVGASEVSMDIAEAGLEKAREAMREAVDQQESAAQQGAGKCPVDHSAVNKPDKA